MNGFDATKMVVSGLAGAGTSKLVKSFIKQNMLAPEGKYETVMLNIGLYSIGTFASFKVTEHIESKFDGAKEYFGKLQAKAQEVQEKADHHVQPSVADKVEDAVDTVKDKADNFVDKIEDVRRNRD